MEDVNISKFRAQVVRAGSTPASPGFAVSEGQNPVDPSGSGQNHLPVTIGSPANGLAVTDSQILTIDKAQIFAGTSSQFVKGDGTLDSTAYGTGSVTSVALTMPTAFSVANSPVTTTGTLAVTATGTTSQYIRGDGSLETFPALTGFVPYTGATADVNLGTFDLLAERGTFENNGSSNTLTVNHTSGSGYGIIVTKGGNNEALYVSKTSGSGNAMSVVGGRTSLVDLALSSVTNTAGDFLTLSGGVVHKRTAAQTLTDIGGQAALTNPVTGTGTTNYLPKFTGSTTIGNSLVFDNGTSVGIGTATPFSQGTSPTSLEIAGLNFGQIFVSANTAAIRGVIMARASTLNDIFISSITNSPLAFGTNDTERMRIFSNGNVFIGSSPTDAGFKLDVNGTGRFSGDININGTNAVPIKSLNIYNDVAKLNVVLGSAGAGGTTGVLALFNSAGTETVTILGTGAATFLGNVGIGTASPSSFAGYLNTTLQATGASGVNLDFKTSGGTREGVLLLASGSEFALIAATAIPLTFRTTDTERMRITSGGNVLIGTTTDNGAKFQLSSSGSTAQTITGAGSGSYSSISFVNTTTGYGYDIGFGGSTTIAPNSFYIYGGSSASVKFSINATGSAFFSSLGTGTVTATGGVLSTVSDSNYKVESGYIDSAIDKVLKLKPRYFYWNEKSGLPKDIRQLGFYAQEVNEALGEEAANTPQDKNTPWGISDRSIIAMLTKAIQEQQEIINDLKQKIS